MVATQAHQMFAHLLTLFAVTSFPAKCQVATSSSTCGKVFNGTDHGTIQSPRYPGKPANNEFCNYVIYVSNGKQVSVEFEVMKTEPSNVYLGYVLLFDGADCMSERIAFDYPSSSYVYVSTRSPMTALYISEFPVGGNFLMHYDAVTKQDPTTPSSEEVFLVNCGEELTAGSGKLIMQQVAPDQYLLCIWRITVASGLVVKLNITNLQLKRSAEWLRVLDGGDCGSPTLLAAFRPKVVAPAFLTSTDNTMTVVLSIVGSTRKNLEAFYYSEPRSSGQ